MDRDDIRTGQYNHKYEQYRRSHEAIFRPNSIDKAVQAPTSSLHVSKHDNHSIEVRNVVELTRGKSVNLTTETFLFLPKSVHLSTWSKADLREDYHSQVRFSVPFLCDGGNGVMENAERDFILVCASFAKSRSNNINNCSDSILDDPDSKAQEFINSGRRYAAVLSEVLKNHAASHKKKLRSAAQEADPIVSAAHICTLRSSVHEVERIMGSCRSMMADSRVVSSKDLGATQFLALLNEYASHLYIGYLGSLNKYIKMFSLNSSVTALIELRSLKESVTQLISKEAALNISERSLNTEQHDEHHSLHRSNLKKFFQSSLFFDVVPHRGRQRLSEPAAVMGALLAASSAYVVEIIRNPVFKTYASQGAFVVCFGIFLYVLRDRLKDLLKNKFMATLDDKMPDSEKHLFAKKKLIGVSKSWLKAQSKHSLPLDVRQARAASARTLLEKAVPEDVLHYRREIAIDGSTTVDENEGPVLSLRDGLRVNLERYLRFLDDPYKNLFELQSDGSVSERKAHKVYNFYFSVKTTCTTYDSGGMLGFNKKKITLLVDSSTYRIVLDKHGIQRVEFIGIVRV